MAKRILAFILTISMVVSMGVFAQETQSVASGAFSDVVADHANTEAIKELTDMGIINGYGDGTFKPENPITRAEFVKMLMVLNGSENANVQGVVTGFPDVDQNSHWAGPHIKTAVDLKIINGYPDGTFKPDDNVKYEEAIKMVVCYLGREQAAKDRAASAKINLYPDAYLSIGNELFLSKNVSNVTGQNASRANVAQIIYNAKDIQKITQNQTGGGTTIIAPIVGGGGGGGSFGGGGSSSSKLTLDEAIEKGRNWSGKRTGRVVAAAKIDGNNKKMQYFLENGITTREGAIDNITQYQMIVKMDKEIDYCDYILFIDRTRTKSFTEYLAHDVSVSFTYDGDDDAFYINSIESLQESDTVGSISSNDVLIEKTNAYNTSGQGDYGIVYFDSRKEKEYTLKLPLELNDLTVIYNDKLVDTVDTPLTIDDFIPKSGTISYVDDGRGEYKLIRIASYETYVVERVITSTPRGIEDKYRKADDGITPLRLVLDDRENSGIDIFVKKSTGEASTVSNIRSGNVLVVAASKCATYINLTVYNNPLTNRKISGFSSEGGIVFADNPSKTYPYSEYFKTYAQGSTEMELGDRVTAYLNDKNEIAWISQSEASYTIGYLKDAILDTTQTPSVLTLRIITGGSTPSLESYTVSKTTKIRTAVMSGGQYALSASARYEDMADFYNVLTTQAGLVNSGKASSYNINAEVAQPIRFVSEGSEIEQLETMALDVDNRFTGTPLMYTGTQFKGENGDMRQYSASTSATYIFVPNDRDWAVNIFKMGTASQCSSKLEAYGRYNVEPFFIPNSNGGLERKVFVIYNEDIESRADYKSETIIVESITPKLNSSNTSVWEITARNGYGNSKTTYTTESLSTADNAYVLDSNFARISDGNGGYVTRAVSKGDVIRFGYTPGGAVRNIEIVYDISEGLDARKGAAYNYKGDSIALGEAEYAQPTYYGRVGIITNIPNNPEYCTLSVGLNSLSNLFVGADYYNQKVCLNTYKNDGAIALENTTMDNLNEGDMVYVWQSYSNGLKIKAVYAVRYAERDLMGEYEAENAPTPDPGTGNE